MSARSDGLVPVGPGCYVRGRDRVTARRAWARGGRWRPDSRGQAAPRGPVNFRYPRGPESPAWRRLPVLQRWHCPHGPRSLRLVPPLLDVQSDRLPRRVEAGTAAALARGSLGDRGWLRPTRSRIAPGHSGYRQCVCLSSSAELLTSTARYPRLGYSRRSTCHHSDRQMVTGGIVGRRFGWLPRLTGTRRIADMARCVRKGAHTVSVHLATPDAAEFINFGVETIRILEDGSHTGHRVSVVEASLPRAAPGLRSISIASTTRRSSYYPAWSGSSPAPSRLTCPPATS